MAKHLPKSFCVPGIILSLYASFINVPKSSDQLDEVDTVRIFIFCIRFGTQEVKQITQGDQTSGEELDSNQDFGLRTGHLTRSAPWLQILHRGETRIARTGAGM